MRYTQFNEQGTADALQAIGVSSIDDLFRTIPKAIRRQKPLDIPVGVSELELLRDVQSMAAKNHSCQELCCFLGGGAYDHFIPTVVDALAGQSEFLTAYTPYQAEASQGILQLFFEFQTMVAMITGMEVANASLYEVASAAAEAVVMAAQVTRRHGVVVADSVHPDTRRVLETYGSQRDWDLQTIDTPNGTVDEQALADAVSNETAVVVIQSPNFFGCVEELDRLVAIAQKSGALAVVATDPIACGVLKPPGAFGADLVVAEGQALGIPLQYGGPYLGLMAGREKYLRKLPGRVVGMTKDAKGRRGFCLALQTREQHIKRERATSNICTNQGLLATRACIYMATVGRSGLAEVASQCFDKAHYAAERIAALPDYELRFDRPFFKEFVVRTKHRVKDLLDACRSEGILGGVPMARFDDHLSDCFLVAVTEKRTKAEIDALVEILKRF